jgi:prolyl-tRNA editing enzyme YbaK/EbsC (Cys-tRNA(Pro) deacylase)
VLFISEGEPVLTLVRGSDYVHMGKLKDVLSSTEVRMASLEEVLKITGYTLGATPPVALAHPVKISWIKGFWKTKWFTLEEEM